MNIPVYLYYTDSHRSKKKCCCKWAPRF